MTDYEIVMIIVSVLQLPFSVYGMYNMTKNTFKLYEDAS
jgi:hypothetical protein